MTYLIAYLCLSLAVSMTMTTETTRVMFAEEPDFSPKERLVAYGVVFLIHVTLWPFFLCHIIWTLLKK